MQVFKEKLKTVKAVMVTKDNIETISEMLLDGFICSKNTDNGEIDWIYYVDKVSGEEKCVHIGEWLCKGDSGFFTINDEQFKLTYNMYPLTYIEDFSKRLHCNFCGSQQIKVKHLIAGTGVYICDECINMCSDLLKEAAEKRMGDYNGAKRS